MTAAFDSAAAAAAENQTGWEPFFCSFVFCFWVLAGARAFVAAAVDAAQ